MGKKNNDDYDVSGFVNLLHSEMEQLMKELDNYKTDVEVTCKMTFNDVPTYFAYSREMQQNIDTIKQNLKNIMVETPGVKTSVRVKMKDKYIEPEDPMKNRKFDASILKDPKSWKGGCNE